MSLEVIANLASVLTAVVAFGAAVYLWCDRRKKIARLEDYLRKETADNPARKIHTTLHLMAALGMTEAEIFHAAFASKHVVPKIRANRDNGLAEHILFEYSETPKSN